jgi:hypothetical protein
MRLTSEILLVTSQSYKHSFFGQISATFKLYEPRHITNIKVVAEDSYGGKINKLMAGKRFCTMTFTWESDSSLTFS